MNLEEKLRQQEADLPMKGEVYRGPDPYNDERTLDFRISAVFKTAGQTEWSIEMQPKNREGKFRGGRCYTYEEWVKWSGMAKLLKSVKQSKVQVEYRKEVFHEQVSYWISANCTEWRLPTGERVLLLGTGKNIVKNPLEQVASAVRELFGMPNVSDAPKFNKGD